MKIAVYTIALNEAAHAERWARSAADADYRIVADTGSTDDTVERLSNAGVTVHRIAIRPWRFDVARNTAMALIPWAPGTTALCSNTVYRARVDDPVVLRGWPSKSFHHRWGYRFTRPVHEALSYSGQEVTRNCLDIVMCEVQDHSKETRKQYLPLMELAHKEDPNDAQICFWLGRDYMWANRNVEGSALLQRYLELPTSTWTEERSEAMRYLARMQPDRKLFWLEKARNAAPHRREIWLDLAEDLHDKADWSNLFWACANGIEKTRRTGSYLDDTHSWGFRLFDLGAIACWHLKAIDRGTEWATKALEFATDDQRQRLKVNLDFFLKHREEHRRPFAPTGERRKGIRKKGIICDISWLASYICQEHHYLVRLLEAEHGFDVIDSKGSDFASAETIEKLNSYDALVIAYQGLVANIPVDELTAYTIFKVDDLVTYSEDYDRLMARLVPGVDMIISPYAYAFHRFFQHGNVVWFPYSSSLEQYDDVGFNTDPMRKVLVSGSVAWDRPFREYAANLKSESIEVLAHPGYDKRYDHGGSSEIVGLRYYQEINRYLCCFCDAHLHRYIHLKVFEIASVGSLLLADKLVEPEMNKLGFVDNETCIFSDNDSFLDKVSWICDESNRLHVDRIRRAGMNLARTKHLTRHRAAELNEIVNRAISQRDSEPRRELAAVG